MAACCWLSPVHAMDRKQPDEGPGQNARGAPQRGERRASGCAGGATHVGMLRALLGAMRRRARGWPRTVNGAAQALRSRLVAPRGERRSVGRLAARARDDVAPCRVARLRSRPARGGGLEQEAALKRDCGRAASRASGALGATGRAPNMSGSVEPSSHTRSATGAASPSGCAAGAASTNVSFVNVHANICVSSMAAAPWPPARGAAHATRGSSHGGGRAQRLKHRHNWLLAQTQAPPNGVQQRKRRQRRRNVERL